MLGTTAKILDTSFVNLNRAAEVPYSEQDGTIRAAMSNLILVRCTFNDSAAVMLGELKSNITIIQSSFEENNPFDSVLLFKSQCNVIILNSTFHNSYNYVALFVSNSAAVIGTQVVKKLVIMGSKIRNNGVRPEHTNIGRLSVIRAQLTNVTIVETEFTENRAAGINRGMIDIEGGILSISECELRNNTVAPSGTITIRSATVSISKTKFVDNTERAIFVLKTSTICITECSFIGVLTQTGGGLEAYGSFVNVTKSEFISNVAEYGGGAMYLIRCRVSMWSTTFDNNVAEVVGGALRAENTFIDMHESEFRGNKAKMGGAIYATADGFELSIVFSGSNLVSNHAEHRGVISITSIMNGKEVLMVNNSATEKGGGIYLDHYSQLICHDHNTLKLINNSASHDGGGIYATKFSSIKVNFNHVIHHDNVYAGSAIFFIENQASRGGGLYLEFNSSVGYISECQAYTILDFTSNRALYGGAMYVADHHQQETPKSSNDIPVCFVLTNNRTSQQCHRYNPFFKSSLNYAEFAGSILFKEKFDYCNTAKDIVDEFKYLNTISNIQSVEIGSLSIQVCFCKDGLPDCIYQLPFIGVKNGERFQIEVAIADRGNHAVNGSILSQIQGGLIPEEQRMQKTSDECTNLIFNVFSTTESQQLTMSPLVDSPYITVTNSKLKVEIRFLSCISCPIGFEKIIDEVRGCNCNCDSHLKPYITDCNISTDTVIKQYTTAWISYISSSENSSGYLVYPHCPLNYCFPPDSRVQINFNIPNGADAQCAHNHHGILCGACKPGLSLSLGSSRCLQCSKHWPKLLVAILLGGFLVGIILVAFILVLNLTVAVGTLNGLIFYANIVAANRITFFPSTNFITVFISWLNLELGIDTCFFNGMDVYWKTWIELIFPMYIIFLVVMVIMVSEYSVRFAQLIGKKNPVATLGSLILLSYVKFIRIIITTFSFAILDYPDKSHHIVWLPDATVKYFSGKHVVLLTTATLILIAGIAYTIILFSWQWLLYHQSKKVFKWMIRSQRLRMFLEPYHAPYAFKHRYWTGLLLVARVLLYIISATNASGDPGISIFATGIVVSSLLILKGLLSNRVYRQWPLEVLEIACYVNIVWFSLSICSLRGEKGHAIASYISGTITLALFFIVLSYHVLTELVFKSRLWKEFQQRRRQRYNDEENEQIDLNKDKETPVTYSEIDPPMTTHSEVPLLALIDQAEHIDYGHGPPKNDRDNIKQVESQSIKTDTTIPYQLASEIN